MIEHSQPEPDHDHWTWSHEACGYQSPFFWHSPEGAQTSLDDHTRTCRQRLRLVKS